jgi:two-component system phosphate regulon sensor histidine kinase PhoR
MTIQMGTESVGNMTVALNYLDTYVPKILVVDDEQRIRDACRMILDAEGYDVNIAADGTQGVEQITAHHYDIILLDLMMPNLSGFDVLAKVKALHPDTAVIIITGYATLEHSVEAMKKGAFDFIPKPFTPEHLRVVVAKAIDHILALRDIAYTRSRLRTMVNSLTDGVMCTNRQHGIVLANPAFRRMLNCRGEEITGQFVDDVITDERVREMIRATLETPPEAAGEITQEIVLANGTGSKEVILSARCVPFRDRSKTNIGVITVLHDITAQRQMDRMKSDFVSMVSHEIRSPMNSILMQLHVVLDGLAGTVTDKQREILERASHRIENLALMTSELLDLASIESGLIVQQRTLVRMDDLIREQCDLHRAQADAKEIRLTTDVPGDLPSVLADRRNMEEILTNLITNAIKYTPEKGQIDLKASVQADYLCVQVSDTGFGMEAEEKEHIFDRFYRIKNSQTRYIQGTGLGLAIVKSIIESHQGRIEVDSRPGEGSTFRVFLPLLPE